jgi:hypothetical protein
MKGAASLPPPVLAQYARWLEAHERQIETSSRVGELSPFWSRLSMMTLKFAVLLQAAHDRNLAISSDTMERAIGLTEFLKRALMHLFEDEFAFTKDMQDRQRILRLVERRSGLSFRDLLRASSMLKRNLDPILDTLAAEGRIERKPEGIYLSAPSEAVSRARTDGKVAAFVR